MAGQIGPQQRRQYSVLGDTTNTAARLMSAASAGRVLVGEETYRATRRLVRFREVAAIEAKGKSQPVAAWEALEVAPLPGRGPSARPRSSAATMSWRSSGASGPASRAKVGRTW